METSVEAEVRARVRDVIAKTLDMQASEIDDGTPLTEYGINSVDLIDVIVKLEREYQVQFIAETMNNLTCESLSNNLLKALPPCANRSP